MIKKSILICISLFLLYNYIFVPIFIRDDSPVAQSQWQENIIKAQDYLYLPVNSNAIIVGSSLSADLKDSTWYNLSFLGGSLFTGLELIKLKRNYPKVILIETNVIYRGIDSEITSTINQSPFNKLKYIFPAFLEKGQPIKYLGALLYSCVEKNPYIIHTEPDSSLFNKYLKLQVEANSTLTNKVTIDRNITLLRSYLKFFDEHHVKIFLVEMPIHSTLFQTINESYRRKELFKAFPISGYNWIIPNSLSNYQTTDGVHLSEKSVKEFKQEIMNTIK